MSGGILGQMFTPASTVRKRAVEDLKHTLFDVIGPEALDEALNEEQRAQLQAATFGIARNDLDCVTECLVDRARGDFRRDAMRERVWQIEADLVARFPDEVTAEVQLAQSKPQEQKEGTRKSYQADQRHFMAYCQKLGVAAMPAAPAVLAKYILDECAPSVVRRKLAGIADWHAKAGHLMPKRHVLVRVAIAEVMKSAATQQPAAPSSSAGEEEKPNEA